MMMRLRFNIIQLRSKWHNWRAARNIKAAGHHVKCMEATRMGLVEMIDELTSE